MKRRWQESRPGCSDFSVRGFPRRCHQAARRACCTIGAAVRVVSGGSRCFNMRLRVCAKSRLGKRRECEQDLGDRQQQRCCPPERCP